MFISFWGLRTCLGFGVQLQNQVCWCTGIVRRIQIFSVLGGNKIYGAKLVEEEGWGLGQMVVFYLGGVRGGFFEKQSFKGSEGLSFVDVCGRIIFRREDEGLGRGVFGLCWQSREVTVVVEVESGLDVVFWRILQSWEGFWILFGVIQEVVGRFCVEKSLIQILKGSCGFLFRVFCFICFSCFCQFFECFIFRVIDVILVYLGGVVIQLDYCRCYCSFSFFFESGIFG